MFAKYSVLFSLFFSLVAALDVSVPLLVHSGTSVELEVDIVSGDPSNIGLLLCVADGSFDINLATSVPVRPTIKVEIPAHVHPRPDYFIAAIEVQNSGIIYSKSNLFEIERGHRVPMAGVNSKLRPERF